MKTANIIILAGQSNAVGVGYTHYLPKHFPADKVQKYHDGYENIQMHFLNGMKNMALKILVKRMKMKCMMRI